MTEQEVLTLYPELKLILELLHPSDKILLVRYLKKINLRTKKHPDISDSLLNQIVNGINRAEIQLTKGVIAFGATLALLQGRVTEFKTLIESEISNKNPAIYNLLTLEALILKGNNYEAFSWITKSLDVYVSYQDDDDINNIDSIQGEEIFTHILAYYCYQLMGKLEEADNSFEEASRLHAVRKYRWNYFYFWLIYFKAKVAYNLGIFGEAIQNSDEALALCSTQLSHRIYQGLCLQLKGQSLVAIERNVEGLNLYHKAKNLFEITNSVFSISINADIAILESKVGRYDKAKNFFQKTITETELLSGGGMEVAPLLQLPGHKGLAELYLLQGNYFLAEDTYLKTLRLAKNTNAIELEAHCLEKLGSIKIDLKNYQEAQNYFIESLQITTDLHLNKTNTLLEYGYLALLMNNVDLALTQLWYLRNLSKKKNLGHEITLFKAQIMMCEKKFDLARFELEKIQLRSILKDFLQIRIQVVLAKLTLKELKDEDNSDDTGSEEDCIDEFNDRIQLIKPFLAKEPFPALKIIFILLEVITKWLRTKEKNHSKEFFLQKLEEASMIANNEKNKLIHLSQIIDFYKRRFGRQRIRLGTSHLIELIEILERILISLSPKS